jgi:hypothetical protein
MLGWFRPQCPCDPHAKAWVEQRLAWLATQFPDNVFTTKDLVYPTDDFFPDAHEPTREGASVLLRRVCGLMGVPASRVVLKFSRESSRVSLVNHSGDAMPHAAGTFIESGGHYFITVDLAEIARPSELIGTFAHELAHARLLGEHRINSRTFDHELLTDLTAVFLGFGLFLANSSRNWMSQYSRWPGTDLAKPEYMTPPMYGYALAHIAWFEGDKKPGWAKYLGRLSMTDFREGIKFLFATGDSSFRPRPRAVSADRE